MNNTTAAREDVAGTAELRPAGQIQRLQARVVECECRARFGVEAVYILQGTIRQRQAATACHVEGVGARGGIIT